MDCTDDLSRHQQCQVYKAHHWDLLIKLQFDDGFGRVLWPRSLQANLRHVGAEVLWRAPSPSPAPLNSYTPFLGSSVPTQSVLRDRPLLWQMNHTMRVEINDHLTARPLHMCSRLKICREVLEDLG